jgi:hypothetical protein
MLINMVLILWFGSSEAISTSCLISPEHWTRESLHSKYSKLRGSAASELQNFETSGFRIPSYSTPRFLQTPKWRILLEALWGFALWRWLHQHTHIPPNAKFSELPKSCQQPHTRGCYMAENKEWAHGSIPQLTSILCDFSKCRTSEVLNKWSFRVLQLWHSRALGFGELHNKTHQFYRILN